MNTTAPHEEGTAITPKRIVIICNKQWEADPVLAVLGEKRACPTAFSFAQPIVLPLDPKHDKTQFRPRCVIAFGRQNADGIPQAPAALAEVWCLEDWLPDGMGSSSSIKMAILPHLFAWSADRGPGPVPDLVIALGTANMPTDLPSAGMVLVGTNVFLHNAYPHGSNPASVWDDPRCEALIGSCLNLSSLPAARLQTARYEAEMRFIVPPMCPAAERVILCATNYTAVSVVNVTNYDDYAWADREAVEAMRRVDSRNPVGSVETTHGLIRLQSSAPSLFISAITDREGRFNAEVGSRAYAQNFACAHNAGVTLAWLLPLLI